RRRPADRRRPGHTPADRRPARHTGTAGPGPGRPHQQRRRLRLRPRHQPLQRRNPGPPRGGPPRWEEPPPRRSERRPGGFPSPRHRARAVRLRNPPAGVGGTPSTRCRPSIGSTPAAPGRHTSLLPSCSQGAPSYCGATKVMLPARDYKARTPAARAVLPIGVSSAPGDRLQECPGPPAAPPGRWPPRPRRPRDGRWRGRGRRRAALPGAVLVHAQHDDTAFHPLRPEDVAEENVLVLPEAAPVAPRPEVLLPLDLHRV